MNTPRSAVIQLPYADVYNGTERPETRVLQPPTSRNERSRDPGNNHTSDVESSGSDDCGKSSGVARVLAVLFFFIVGAILKSSWKNPSSSSSYSSSTYEPTYRSTYQNPYLTAENEKPTVRYNNDMEEMKRYERILEYSNDTEIDDTPMTQDHFCTKKRCIEEMKDTVGSMDFSIDPCQDFYKYSCGGFIKNANFSKDGNYTSFQVQRSLENLRIVNDLLSSIPKSKFKRIPSYTKTYAFYRSCVTVNGTALDLELKRMSLLSKSDADEFTDVTSKARLDSNLLGSIMLKEKLRRKKRDINGWDDNNVEGNKTTLDDIDCAYLTEDFFPDVVNRLFVWKMYDPYPEIGAALKTTVNQVVEILRARIAKANWVKTGKYNLDNKLNRLNVSLGAPAKTYDDNYVNNLYKNVDISSDDFIGNVKALAELEVRKNITRMLRKSVGLETDEVDIKLIVSRANAYYMVKRNEVLIPAGLTLPPFFDPTYPPVINFAKVGFIIAHELGHLVSSALAENLLDVFGEIKSVYSWTSTDFALTKKAKCMMDQYDSYYIPGTWTKVNGTKTLRENLADILGLQVSLQTYMQKYGLGKYFPKIFSYPGNFTEKQLFFAASAQFHCEAYRNDQVRRLMAKEDEDDHSPSPIRVLGKMRNFEEFQKAFNCKSSSRYVVRDRCYLL